MEQGVCSTAVYGSIGAALLLRRASSRHGMLPPRAAPCASGHVHPASCARPLRPPALGITAAPELPDPPERVLPSGARTLLTNIAEDELRWYDGAAASRRCEGGAPLAPPPPLAASPPAKAHAEYITIDTADTAGDCRRGVHPRRRGAVLRPGRSRRSAAPTSRSRALWGREADLVRERVLRGEEPLRRRALRALESALASRLLRPARAARAATPQSTSRSPRSRTSSRAWTSTTTTGQPHERRSGSSGASPSRPASPRSITAVRGASSR